jgi:hypothetical protein
MFAAESPLQQIIVAADTAPYSAFSPDDNSSRLSSYTLHRSCTHMEGPHCALYHVLAGRDGTNALRARFGSNGTTGRVGRLLSPVVVFRLRIRINAATLPKEAGGMAFKISIYGVRSTYLRRMTSDVDGWTTCLSCPSESWSLRSYLPWSQNPPV